MSEGRNVEQRKADTLAALHAQRDLWLATADTGGKPHLIAVSAWWDGNHLIIATTAASRSARNLDSTGIARLGLGAPADVIVIDAVAAGGVQVRDADAQLAAGVTEAVGWDPREIRRSLGLLSSKAGANSGLPRLRRTGRQGCHAARPLVGLMVAKSGRRS